MKKEESKLTSNDNSFGVASVVLGILSILLASLNGIILGIIALVFSQKQTAISANKWSRAGKILSIIGIIVGILTLVLIILGITQNPELFNLPPIN